MEMNYSTIEGKSRNYRILVAVLGLLVVGLIISYLVTYLLGQQVLDTSNAIPWGQLIIIFIYFVGLSAGAIVVSSLSYVFGKGEYQPIGRIAVFIGLLMMIGAMVSVLVDLGRPEKFWRLFIYGYTSNMTSMFAVNGILYGVYILLMIVYLWLVIENKHKLATTIGIIDVLWAITVHTGTGAIFGFIGTREILGSPLKPFEFITAALTSGTALLIIVTVLVFKYTNRLLDNKVILSLGRLLSFIIIGLTTLVFFDKMTHVYFPEREGTVFLFTGPYWWLFWILQVGMGLVLPLIILFHPKYGKTVKGVVVAAISVVIGVLGERAAIIIPGTAQVQPLYPGEIQGVWGAPGAFSIGPWETMLTVGVIALVALIFVLGLKYLELLPAAMKPEPAKAPAETAAKPAEASK